MSSTSSPSQALGPTNEVRLAQGVIRYRDTGEGRPLIFVHGAFVDGQLWRKVVPELSDNFRCIVPDLPLGSHSVAFDADADLSPYGLAKLIADFIAALDLDDVTLVGNDTGGGLCQIVVTRHPERISGLVLTPCDAYEDFPPRFFHFLLWAARVPGGLFALLQPTRLTAVRHSPIGFGWLAKRLDKNVTYEWSKRPLSDRDVRRDLVKVLKGLDAKYTLEAAEKLREFRRPVLIAWAPEKDFFKWEHAERLARDFPDARLERIDDSYTFVSEDQPQRLADLIQRFMQETARGERTAA
jgi:pimeloyl-ACP methyl ester carboxylesterase